MISSYALFIQKLNGDDNKIEREMEDINKKLTVFSVQTKNLENSIDDKISTCVSYYSASLDQLSSLIDDLTAENKRRDEDIEKVNQTQETMSKYMEDLTQNTKKYIEESTSNFEMAHNDLLGQIDIFNAKQAVMDKKLDSNHLEQCKIKDDIQDKSLELITEQQTQQGYIERLQGSVEALTIGLQRVIEDLQQLQQQKQLEWNNDLLLQRHPPKLPDPADQMQNERLQGTLNSISDNSKMMSEAIKLLKDEQQRLSDRQKFHDQSQSPNDNPKSFVFILIVGILFAILLQLWQNSIRR